MDWLMLNSESEAYEYCKWLNFEINEIDNDRFSLVWTNAAPSKPWKYTVCEAIEQTADNTQRADIIRGTNYKERKGSLEILPPCKM